MDLPGGDGRERDERIATITPRVEAAGERPHALDAATSQEQRHPGARRLVGSGAIEDDVAIARNLPMPRLELFGHQMQRSAGKGNPICSASTQPKTML
jgi:hypothetical protein